LKSDRSSPPFFFFRGEGRSATFERGRTRQRFELQFLLSIGVLFQGKEGKKKKGKRCRTSATIWGGLGGEKESLLFTPGGKASSERGPFEGLWERGRKARHSNLNPPAEEKEKEGKEGGMSVSV